MPDHRRWEGDCRMNNSLFDFLTDTNKLYWTVLCSYLTQWRPFQSYPNAGFVTLNLLNCGGPSGHSTPRQHHGHYSSWLQSPHLPWPSITLSSFVTLCKTHGVFSGAGSSAPFPTSGAPSSTFVHFTPAVESDPQRTGSVLAQGIINAKWIQNVAFIRLAALFVIQWNLSSNAKGRPFLLLTWT